MTDPGVPTGDKPPRWTVDEEACLWFGPTSAGGWLDIYQAGTTAEDAFPLYDDPTPAYSALVQAVRDAARVPALEATAQKWEQARGLMATYCRLGTTHAERTRALDGLAHLLTEAPDGE